MINRVSGMSPSFGKAMLSNDKETQFVKKQFGTDTDEKTKNLFNVLLRTVSDESQVSNCDVFVKLQYDYNEGCGAIIGDIKDKDDQNVNCTVNRPFDAYCEDDANTIIRDFFHACSKALKNM